MLLQYFSNITIRDIPKRTAATFEGSWDQVELIKNCYIPMRKFVQK